MEEGGGERNSQGREEGGGTQSSISDGKLSGRVQHSMVIKPVTVGLSHRYK